VVNVPASRNPVSIDAEKRYKAGEKLVDIARSLNVPDSTVRRWKSTQNWDGERSETNPNARNKKADGKPKPKTLDEKLVDKVEENDELTPAQKDFCLRFVNTCNATMAYVGAYDCTYNAARSSASALLTKPSIQAEVQELRKIKHLEYGGITGQDVVAMHMKIAFADIRDYVEFESKYVPVLHNGIAVTVVNPKTEKAVPVTKLVNTVKLKSSAKVDGQLITEVSEGREGAKIKLADRQRSLAFLERYFELNPMDTHRKEYDKKKYEMDLLRHEKEEQENTITDIEDISTLAELLNDDYTDSDD
jgi:phage terminase small subunit